MKRFFALLCGFFCFAVTQIFTRIPLLAHFDFELSVIGLRAPYLMLLLPAFSAGLFEETGRFLFSKTALKHADFKDAILFGLGHSLMEITYLFYTAGVFHGAPLSLWAILERMSVTLFHMASAVFMLEGIRRGNGIRTLLLAILFHGAFDLAAVFFVRMSVSIGEALLFAIAGFYFSMVVRKRALLKEAR